jgi:hypothetical protein
MLRLYPLYGQYLGHPTRLSAGPPIQNATIPPNLVGSRVVDRAGDKTKIISTNYSVTELASLLGRLAPGALYSVSYIFRSLGFK